MLIWYASIDDEMVGPILSSLEKYVSAAEKSAIEKYHFVDDRKRSLVSLLLQKGAIRHTFPSLGTNFAIQRTREVVTFFRLRNIIHYFYNTDLIRTNHLYVFLIQRLQHGITMFHTTESMFA